MTASLKTTLIYIGIFLILSSIILTLVWFPWTYSFIFYRNPIYRDILINQATLIGEHSLKPSQINQANKKYVYPELSAYVSPRTAHIPVMNEYHHNMPLCNQSTSISCGDFHIVLYYLDIYSGWLSLRRLDEDRWNFPFQLMVYDKDDHTKVDVINIDPSPSISYTKQFISTNIPLHQDHMIYRNQTIPKRIVQTYYSREALNTYHWNAYHTFLDLNPEYEVILLNNQDCRAFIKANFISDVLEAYDSLVPAAFQADLFRYSYLYVYGGCYFDNKMIARQALRVVLEEYDDFIVASDTLPGGYMANNVKETQKIYNALICSQPRDKRLYDTIMYILSKIQNKGSDIRYHVSSDLALTGPVAFYLAIINEITEKNLRMKHGYRPTPSDSNYHRDYTDYYVINKLNNQVAFHKAFKYYYRHRHGGYSKLWKDGRIFYDNAILVKDRYSLFLESSSTRLYRYLVNASQLIISRSAWSFTWNILNAGFNIKSHKSGNSSSDGVKVVATSSDGKSFSYLSNGLSCQQTVKWFSEPPTISESKRRKKKVKRDPHRILEYTSNKENKDVGRNTFVKIIEDKSSEEVILSFDLSLSMDVITKIDLCL